MFVPKLPQPLKLLCSKFVEPLTLPYSSILRAATEFVESASTS